MTTQDITKFADAAEYISLSAKDEMISSSTISAFLESAFEKEMSRVFTKDFPIAISKLFYANCLVVNDLFLDSFFNILSRNFSCPRGLFNQGYFYIGGRSDWSDQVYVNKSGHVYFGDLDFIAELENGDLTSLRDTQLTIGQYVVSYLE